MSFCHHVSLKAWSRDIRNIIGGIPPELVSPAKRANDDEQELAGAANHCGQ